MNNLCIIILTFNEEINIKKCLESIKDFANEIIIIDSFSTDKTKSICDGYKVKFVQHKFENQSKQFNWALSNVNINSNWIMRLDADEEIDKNLAEEIKKNIKILNLEKTSNTLRSNFKTLIVSNNSKNSWANAVIALKAIKFKKRKIIYPSSGKKLDFSIFTKILLKLKIFYDQYNVNKKILRELNKSKFDKIIIIQPFNTYGSILKKIKKRFDKIEIVALFIDPFLHRNYFTFNLFFSLKYFDKIIYRQPYKENYINYFNRGFKIRCFPGVVKIKKKLERKNYTYDVTFIGTYEEERYQVLKYLSQNNIKITVFGNGWQNIK